MPTYPVTRFVNGRPVSRQRIEAEGADLAAEKMQGRPGVGGTAEDDPNRIEVVIEDAAGGPAVQCYAFRDG